MLENIVASDIAIIVVPIYFLFIFFESIANHFFHARGAGDWKDNGVSMGLGMVSAALNGSMAFISVGALYWAQQYQFAVIPLTFASLLICFGIIAWRIGAAGCGRCTLLTTAVRNLILRLHYAKAGPNISLAP